MQFRAEFVRSHHCYEDLMLLTWLEDGRDTDCRADSLSEEYLPILSSQAGHHDTKDMQKTAAKNQPARPKLVVKNANNGTHAHHEEDLERRDPGDRAIRIIP